MKAPTYRDIARECGVNASTVSRALANSPKVSAAVRQRIQATASRLGWRPNPLLSIHMAHLRSTRQARYKATIAFVFPFREVTRFADVPGYTQEVYRGAERRAAQIGYKLEPIWLHDLDHNGARLSRLLASRGIPGAILYGNDFRPETYQGFEWDQFAVATWGVPLPGYRLHHAACHYLHNVPIALEVIRRYGYKRVGMILSAQQDVMSDRGFFSAFYYLEHHHRRDEWVKSCWLDNWMHTPANINKVRSWLEKNRPEVIFGEQMVWEAIHRMGWRVPEDIAFVSPFWSGGKWAHVAGIDQCPEVVGSNVFDLVSSQITRNERGIPAAPKFLLHEGRWMDGATLPDRTQPAATRSPGRKSTPSGKRSGRRKTSPARVAK